jgi:ABC-2 type transport system ATP-binding protein
MEPVITAAGLSKRYGAVTAVVDVSLEVARGEIFGIVGPNGAGKTTTIEMMQGLRRTDGGTVRVLGLDPQRDVAEIRQRVGTQLQNAVLPDRMKVWEALDLYASYYASPADVDALLDDWDLRGKRDASFDSLSGGQRQRLFIALALVGSPEMVFLDELTTGLDPLARRLTWDHVRAIRDGGVTVVLVTHFMDEAEALCDRIAVIDSGRVAALDTPSRLTRRAGQTQRVRFTAPVEFSPAWLARIAGVECVDQHGTAVVVTGTGALLAGVATALAAHGAAPDDLTVERSSLEDAFLAITSAAAADTSHS